MRRAARAAGTGRAGSSPAVVGALLLAACAGLPAPGPTARDSTAPDVLRVATYNIRHGVGLDGALDLERTAAVLRGLDADLVALQEVDERCGRSGQVDQAARLGELTGLAHAFAAFMEYDGGRYGLALLSRFPVVAVESLRLPDGHEPRVALVAELALDSGARVHAVVVHFDWVADDAFRFAQAARVVERLEALDAPFLVLGDFNDEPGSRTLAAFDGLATRAAVEGRAATWPADAPTVAIDHLFAGPPEAWAVGPARVLDGALASDHRPLVGELELRGRTRGATAPISDLGP